nr:hypothetical protein [Spiroplasma citri]
MKWKYPQNKILGNSAWHHSFGGYDADSRSTFIVNQMDVVSNAESESTTYSRVKNALEKNFRLQVIILAVLKMSAIFMTQKVRGMI